MNEYIINVSEIEDLQVVKDRDLLENIFQRAKSTIVNGEKVILVRKGKEGPEQRFDEFTTLDELQHFKKRVFKYL